MLFDISLYLALTICLGGLLWRINQWLSLDIGSGSPGTRLQRFAAALKGMSNSVLSGRCLAIGFAFIRDILPQLHLLRLHPLRWLMHTLLFWGFALLLLMHVFDESITLSLFPDYASTLNPFFFLRNLLGALVLTGLIVALYRRIFIFSQKRVTTWGDHLPLLLLAAIIISGFLVEAAQIISEPLFEEMVADYHGSDDADEVAALKAVWAQEYHVVFDPPAEINAELLAEGADLNDESCLACHSKPASAFGSLPLALLAKPLAPVLNKNRADIVLWHLHYLICFAGLALLPFTKFLHLVTTPLTLVLKAGAPPSATAAEAAVKSESTSASFNRKTRRALTLDGCTHCGACSRHCSVGPSADIIANANILPSEKMLSLRWFSRQYLSDTDRVLFSEGSFICTECYRCTRICPSGLDLQDLWRAGKTDLARAGLTELHTRAVQQPTDTLFKVMSAAPPDTQTASGIEALDWHDQGMDLCDDPATFQACVQCAICSSVCPVVAAASVPDHDPEIGPHLVTNLLRMRQPELAQASSMVWSCVTCYQCQEHCPQYIRVADLLYELRNRAWSRLKNAPAESWALDGKEEGS